MFIEANVAIEPYMGTEPYIPIWIHIYYVDEMRRDQIKSDRLHGIDAEYVLQALAVPLGTCTIYSTP
jgi:hypothetical protein